MNELKHTPGPWYALPARAGFYIQAENDIIVDTADQNARYGTIDDEANARLIAAAPELLEALKALHHAVCGETGFAEAVRNCSGIAYPWEPLDAADLAARAAIAKAEGGEP